MRSALGFFFFPCSFLAAVVFVLAGCADTTQTCQSGPRYGTQCYNSSLQTTYSSPASTPAPPATSPPSPMSTKQQR